MADRGEGPKTEAAGDEQGLGSSAAGVASVSSSGSAGARHRWAAAASKVHHANTMHAALEAMSGTTMLGIDKKNAVLAIAKLRHEDELRRDESKKTFVIVLLFVVVFLDFLGNMLMIPVGQDIYLAFPGEHHTNEYVFTASGCSHDVECARYKGYGHFGYGAAEHFGGVANTILVGPAVVGLGQFASSLLSGHMANRFGKKESLLVFTFGGAFFFAMNYVSRDWGIWPYFFVRFLTGLFAGSRPIVNMYIAELYEDPMERLSKMAYTTTVMLASLSMGPVAGGVMIGMGNLFVPLLGAAVLECVAGVLVLVYVPSVTSAAKRDQDGAARPGPPPPSTAKPGRPPWMNLVFCLWIGRFLDNSAQGILPHFQTTALQAYPLLRNKTVFSVLVACISCMIWFSIKLSGRVVPKLGMAWTGVACQLLMGCGYILMSLAQGCDDGEDFCVGLFAYLVPLFPAVMVGSVAGMLIAPTLLSLVPPEKTNTWLGYQAAVVAVLRPCCSFVLVLPGFLAHECYHGFFLQLNGFVAFMSAIPYYILTRKFPMPAPKKVFPIEEDSALRTYQETGDHKWLTSEQRHGINLERLHKGESMLTMDFGTFEQDKNDLERIRAMAKKDFSFNATIFPQHIRKWQTGDEAHREEIRMRLRTFCKSDAAKWSEKDKQDFGRWVSDWAEYAGYASPTANPRMWKQILMEALPVLLKGGFYGNETFIENPVPVWLKIDHFFNSYQKIMRMNRETCKMLAFLPTSACRLPGIG